ncbi:TLC domain-containing 2 [Brachionus plicatilis]|uniref:TLC domain-containing 2 n=1 Tax=Brachionus plicatilis TaxID=10195 RepID=A0A3M7QXF6_BRAPC|nr:TLC domain-containing 2 [Brachionus plicatilis]
MSQYKSIDFSYQEWLFYTLSSIIFFLFYNLICAHSLSKFEFLRTHWNFWRFKNTLISWSHAVIASILFAINVYQMPDLLDDMINVSSKFSYIAICVSKVPLSIIIIFIFSITLSLNRYVGYTTAAISIEFNTVFLHLRFMSVFCNIDKNSLKFRLLSILNLVTFVIFRLLTLCWMTRWIILNRSLIPPVWFTIGSLGLVVMMTINIFLLKRLVQSDFSKEKTIMNGSESTIKKSN